LKQGLRLPYCVKSYAAENATDYECVACVTLHETGYELRGRIRVVFTSS